MSRAVQLVLLSVVILTCLQTGVAHSNDDGKSLLWKQYTCVIEVCKYSLASRASPLSRDNRQFSVCDLHCTYHNVICEF